MAPASTPSSRWVPCPRTCRSCLEDAGMAQQMAEYAIYGVIHHQRHMQIYLAQQRDKHWQQHEHRGNVRRPTVGVLGLGEMGGTVATRLAAFGYTVHGWSRSQRQIEGVKTFAGAAMDLQTF